MRNYRRRDLADAKIFAKSAEHLGRSAYHRGEPRSSCPYTAAKAHYTQSATVSAQRRGWLRGWDLAEMEDRS